MTAEPDPTVVDRVSTPRGELVLRRVGPHFEVISNGTFLMDTRDGSSERLLVSAALAAHGAPRHLLLGGLGVGFSLVEAVRHPALRSVDVVEVEERVVDWHRAHLAHLTGHALADERVTVVTSDIAHHLETSRVTYDVICLDVDNGPNWTVVPGNAALYGTDGITATRKALAPDGVLAVWSASPAPAFEAVLARAFETVTVHQVPVRVPRGEPDVVYLGQRPRVRG